MSAAVAPFPHASIANPCVLSAEFRRERVFGVEEARIDHASVAFPFTRDAAITPLLEPLGVMQRTMHPSPASWHWAKEGWLPAVMGMAYTPPSPHRRLPALSNLWAMT